MWEGYSFVNAPQCSLVSSDYSAMDDNTSSESSRGVSPFSDDDLKDQSVPTTCSILELSEQLQLHSLQPQPTTVFPREPPAAIQRSVPTYTRRMRSASPNNFNQKRQHRQALVRGQCSSANLSRLMALAQGIETSSYDASEDPLLHDTEPSPPHHIHTSPPFAQPTLTTPHISDECEPHNQGLTAGPLEHKAGKGPRPYISGDALAGQTLVHKDIRLRTKWRPSTSSR